MVAAARIRRAAARRWRRLLPRVVTIVVVIDPRDVGRLPAALGSVLDQSHTALEVLLAPVGSVSLTASTDPRVRLLPASPTWQDAVGAGAEAAKGDLVGFVRGCDELPAHAVERLAG